MQLSMERQVRLELGTSLGLFRGDSPEADTTPSRTSVALLGINTP